MLRFVADAGSVDGDDPFPVELLERLRELVPADVVSFSELDRVRKRYLGSVLTPEDAEEGDDPVDPDIFWGYVIDAHPVCVYHQTGHYDAAKLSDFVTMRELRRTRLYDGWLRPQRIEAELNVALPSPLWHTKTFLFDRERGDFNERDGLVLDFLQPHLSSLYERARVRRRLAATLAAIDRSSPDDRAGILVLDGLDRVELASPSARRLLRTFFADGGGDRTPDALARWLSSDGQAPFDMVRGDRRLKVTRMADALLLEEHRVEVRLTPREREVLAWVARGKTNAEIAQLLWLAPSTVRKHLENVYAKLGVRTRTAAVARFLGLLDASEESAAG